MSETRHFGGARRILVYGVTGSGKTTVASQISEATGIAWTDVDALTWEPAWTQVSAEEQRRRIGPICAGESWILDTAYASWRDVVLERAEVIVALDAEWAASSSGPPVLRLRSPRETSACLEDLRAGSETAH